MDGISIDQYAVKKSGGFKEVRKEIQAENEGLVIAITITQ
jgi:hypothetical protein